MQQDDAAARARALLQRRREEPAPQYAGSYAIGSGFGADAAFEHPQLGGSYAAPPGAWPGGAAPPPAYVEPVVEAWAGGAAAHGYPQYAQQQYAAGPVAGGGSWAADPRSQQLPPQQQWGGGTTTGVVMGGLDGMPEVEHVSGPAVGSGVYITAEQRDTMEVGAMLLLQQADEWSGKIGLAKKAGALSRGRSNGEGGHTLTLRPPGSVASALFATSALTAHHGLQASLGR